jgi:hypothetical protein
MNEWQSTVLKCNPCEQECAVCKFLAGDRSVEILMIVISRLDKALSDEELFARNLLKSKLI